MSDTDSTQLETDIRQWSNEMQNDRQSLLSVMQKVQERYGMLSEQAMRALSEAYHIQPAEVYSLATLFTCMRLQKPGKYHFKVCDGLACAEKEPFASQVKEKLGIDAGQVSEDGMFSLEFAHCMGMCDLGSVLSINGQVFTQMTAEKLDALLSRCKAGEAFPASDFNSAPPAFWEGKRSESLFSQVAAGSALTCLTHTPSASLIDEMEEKAILSPQTKKRFVESRGDCVLVCNTDSQIPGSFMDRLLIADHSALFVESLLACAYLAHAKQAIIYLRPEYQSLTPLLQSAIGRIKDPSHQKRVSFSENGYSCEIEVRPSPGFVAGGLTHIAEVAVNSNRFAGLKPELPFSPAIMMDVQSILRVGLYLAAKEKGSDCAEIFPTCCVAISGACQRPGIYEVHNQTKLSDLLSEAGCREPAGVWLNGLLGSFHSPDDFDKTLSELSPGGFAQALVFDQQTDFRDLAEKLLRTFSQDSCGQCVPCRDGLNRMTKLFQPPKNEIRLRELELTSIANCVQSASKCEYGRNSARCFLSLAAAFPESIFAG